MPSGSLGENGKAKVEKIKYGMDELGWRGRHDSEGCFKLWTLFEDHWEETDHSFK